MKSEAPLDYAVFQLSPKHTRCELFVSSDGNTEKLASGLMKPFVSHLKVAEQQVGLAVQSIKLENERQKSVETWFTKGTLERFVRFVSTPEVLELVNTFDAEMSQLEAARRIYSQGAGDQLSSSSGGGGARGGGSGSTAAADATKKELLRAIDVRLVALRQDLTMSCARAGAAGFNPDSVSKLQMFADRFGAHRLNEACRKFISVCERRPDLIKPWKAGGDDRAVRASCGSDMSIDEDPTYEERQPTGSHQPQRHNHPTSREPDLTQQQHHLVQSKSSTCQQPKSSSVAFPLRCSRESSIEKDDTFRESDGSAEKEEKEGSGGQAELKQTGPPARRLSVQDRINLFETKQKEITGSGSGGKPVVAKSAELKRLSSDVSSAPTVAEKAVLRRWSGASDMSIDLSCERKETESPLCTPSSSVSMSKTEDIKGLYDTAAVPAEREFKSVPVRVSDSRLENLTDSQSRVISGEELATPKVGLNSGIQLTVSSEMSGEASESNNSFSTSETVDSYSKTKSRSSFNKADDYSLKDQATPQTQYRIFSDGRAERLGSATEKKFEDFFSNYELDGVEKQGASGRPIAGRSERAEPHTRSAGELNKSYQPPRVENMDRGEDLGFKDQSVPISQLRAPLRRPDFGQLEGGSGSKIWESFASQSKGAEGDLLASHSRRKSLGEAEEVGKEEDSGAQRKKFQKQATPELMNKGAEGDLLASHSRRKSLREAEEVGKEEDSGAQRMKFHKQATPEQMKKPLGRREEISSIYGNNKPSFSVKMVSEDQESFGSISTTPVEQARRVRQSKGNQELNDELTMKANELEKLFAEHMLRVPGDMANSTRRSKPADIQNEPATSLPQRKRVADIAPPQLPEKNTVVASSGNSLLEVIDSQDYGEALKQNFSHLGFSDDSRGKFYDMYMQKRDAKLREEWGSKGAEKEAQMKAMQDGLERSRAEMRAKFSSSADRKDSVLGAHWRAERLRSFNSRSIMRTEQLSDFIEGEDDEDPSEFPEQKPFTEGHLGDGVSRSSQSEKLVPNRTLPSTTPRTSAAPIPKSSTKASNSSQGRRRMQSENPLAQSVPNFSDLRKENTKPSSAASKTARPQLRNYSRSRSINEDRPHIREEKPRRSHILRKGPASPAEFKETAPSDSEGVVLTPLKFDIEQSINEKPLKSVESKPFLGKNNGMGPAGAGAGIARLRGSMMSEALNNEEEFDELAFELEDSADRIKEEEGEEFETMRTEDYENVDRGGSRHSQDSEKMVNSGSDNGDTLGSFSQANHYLVTELPAAVSSTFHRVGSLPDSPGESPMSWNSRNHNPFSYTNEASDVDASADSPIGSPAPWNLHSLNQTDADAARMRKKWGSAQKPLIVSNTQSRKDMTKGFKRLLKFGRKSRGTESFVDWVSATTSEGDDDTEDGRDPASRSSEDLRKSRMGFSHGHHSEDSFNESEFFSEQAHSLRSSIPAPPANFKLREDHLSGSSMKAPRSFFSLSTFRSKGSDSKPR